MESLSGYRDPLTGKGQDWVPNSSRYESGTRRGVGAAGPAGKGKVMALARIITRSHQYAQQLALDLLARGYAVEIVSPDATPSGPADLELRVVAGGAEAAGQVTEGREPDKKSRSIEYLQRLKPMMADLLRKWPTSEEKVSGKDAGFSFNAEQQETGDVELPSAADQPSAQHELSAQPTHIEEPVFADSARLISPPAPPKPASPSLSVFSITGEPIVWEESETERGNRSEVWFWRAAVGFASVALLILVLGMALRRSPATPAHTGSTAGTQTVAATAQPSPVKPTTPSPASLTPLPPKAAVIAATVPAGTNAPKAKASAVIRRTKSTQSEEPDTTVTYFNTKAAEPPKENTAKQVSGIKRYSDMN